jgi:hypothetical protein
MDDAAAIRRRIQIAFASVPRPAVEDIAPHRCDECDELRDAFAPYAAEELPIEVLNRHVFDLPLLSSMAKHYYLRAWLYAALDKESWNYVDAATTNIDSNERFDPPGGYSNTQWEAILAWLDYLESAEEIVTKESVSVTAARVRRRDEA